MGANAIHKNKEYKEDVENRIQYVDNIIDKTEQLRTIHLILT